MKTTIAVIAVIIAASLISAASMWSSTLKINGLVKTGQYDPQITSTKLLITSNCQCHCCNCSHHGNGEGAITVDSENPLKAYVSIAHTHGNTTIWVGLVISDKGSIPFRVTGIRTNATSATVYVYGPYQAPGASPVWGHVTPEMLPYPGDTGLPSSICQAPNKLVLWIKIEPGHHRHGCHTTNYEIVVETIPFNRASSWG